MRPIEFLGKAPGELDSSSQNVQAGSRPWRDGTRAIRFEPSEFLERLAVIIARPLVRRAQTHGADTPGRPEIVRVSAGWIRDRAAGV